MREVRRLAVRSLGYRYGTPLQVVPANETSDGASLLGRDRFEQIPGACECRPMLPSSRLAGNLIEGSIGAFSNPVEEIMRIVGLVDLGRFRYLLFGFDPQHYVPSIERAANCAA